MREQVDRRVARENKLTSHHKSVHRVDPEELHPVAIDHEAVHTSQRRWTSIAIAETIHAQAENRATRDLQEDLPMPESTSLDVDIEGKEFTVTRCIPHETFTELECRSQNYQFDNPIYLIDAPVEIEASFEHIASLMEEPNNPGR